MSNTCIVIKGLNLHNLVVKRGGQGRIGTGSAPDVCREHYIVPAAEKIVGSGIAGMHADKNSESVYLHFKNIK